MKKMVQKKTLSAEKMKGRLHVHAFALTSGIFVGLMMLLTAVALRLEPSIAQTTMFTFNPLSAMLSGFIQGCLFGYVFALIYNKLSRIILEKN